MSADTNLFQPGDILTSEWGYEQSNVNYYQVLKRTPQTVVIQEVKKEFRYDDGGRRAYPLKDQFDGEPMRRKIKSGYVSVTPLEDAHPFDGAAYCDPSGWR